MASHSLPVSLQQAQNERSKGAARTRTLPIVIAALIALLILFSWLHLIQALEIADTGRKIQLGEVELERIERTNNELKIKIARAQAPAKLVEAAAALGFRRSQPVYVAFPDSLPETVVNEDGGGVPIQADLEGWTEDDQTLLDFATRELDSLLEVEVAP